MFSDSVFDPSSNGPCFKSNDFSNIVRKCKTMHFQFSQTGVCVLPIVLIVLIVHSWNNH